MSILSDLWNQFQVSLFPRLECVLEAPLSEKQKQFVQVVEIVRVERYIASPHAQWMGRREKDRRSIARAFIAKAVFDLPTTEMLIEALNQQPSLRRLCGFETKNSIPSASTFSRAFAKFAKCNLGDRIHEALVKTYVGDKVVVHLSQDSTEVVAREKPVAKAKAKPEVKPKYKRGRPKKGEIRPAPEPSRIEKQLKQTPEAALAELPYVCDIGSKKDSKGYAHSWTGWKAHIGWADGGIPLKVLTTSASLHDSQAAIPMMRIMAREVISLYDLMDSAYDAAAIHRASKELGHVPIIDPNPRRGASVPLEPDRVRRFKERSTAERGNGRLKDEFGLRHLRVRGHPKAHMHIMFGVMVLFADQLVKLFSG